MLERAMLSEAREGAATWTLEELTGPERRWLHAGVAHTGFWACGEPVRNVVGKWDGKDGPDRCPDCVRILGGKR